jgi:quinol monooxygenase YgiN
MAVTITLRARLNGDQASMQKVHDEVTGATRAMAKQAGDISHRVFVNPIDPRDVLVIDVWQTAEQARAFSADPRIQQFFGQLFDAAPEVTAWVDSGWNEW